jgi:hypothetical protein
MGTVHNQPPRDPKRVSDDSLADFVKAAKAIALDNSISVADVIAAKHALELQRQNDLRAADGDIHDEQMSGLAEAIGSIGSALNNFSETVEKLAGEEK